MPIVAHVSIVVNVQSTALFHKYIVIYAKSCQKCFDKSKPPAILPCSHIADTTLGVPVILFFLLASLNVHASELSGQASLNLDTSAPVTERADIGAFASLFFTPGVDPLTFGYVGPGWQVTPIWWTSPRLGTVLNWPSSGRWSPIVSWWNFLAVDDGRWTLFTETEIYPRDVDVDFYGLARGDYHVGPVGLGAQIESVNAHPSIGPHLTLALGRLTTRVEYYHDFADSQVLRFVFVGDLR